MLRLFPQKLLYRNCMTKWTFHIYRMQNPVNSESFYSYTDFCMRLSSSWNTCQLALACQEAHTYTHKCTHTYTHIEVYTHTQHIYMHIYSTYMCTHTQSNFWHFLGKKMNQFVHGVTRSTLQKKSNFSVYFWGCSCMRQLRQSNSVLLPEGKILPNLSLCTCCGIHLTLQWANSAH